MILLYTADSYNLIFYRIIHMNSFVRDSSVIGENYKVNIANEQPSLVKYIAKSMNDLGSVN